MILKIALVTFSHLNQIDFIFIGPSIRKYGHMHTHIHKHLGMFQKQLFDSGNHET